MLNTDECDLVFTIMGIMCGVQTIGPNEGKRELVLYLRNILSERIWIPTKSRSNASRSIEFGGEVKTRI